MGTQSWMLDLQALQSAQTWEDLPVEPKKYIQLIEVISGVTISQISVSPEREQLFVRDH